MRPCRLIAALAAVLAMPLSAAAATPGNAQYADCTRDAARAPEETYKRARAWYGRDRSMAAQHCMALALYQLREYAQAAQTLDDILERLPPGQARLWLSMKAQAAKAHIAAGSYAAAEYHLDSGLLWAVDKGMDADIVPLLVERARLHDRRKLYLKAVQDLDHAMEIAPSTAIRLQRAQVFLKLDMKKLARQDVETVLKTEPENKQALSVLALTGG